MMIRRSRTTAALIAAGALLALVAACSDDDSPEAGDTVPPSPITAATTSPATTHETPPTTQPASSSTVAPTTTVSEEHVKAEIEADYLEITDHGWELAANPRKKNLEKRVAQVAVTGSPYYETTITRIRELVDRGEYMYLDEPPINKATVQDIELIGEPPYTEAIVIACHVSNANLVTDPIPADEFPGGTYPDGLEPDVAYVGEPSGVRAILYERPLRLTNDGWRRYQEATHEPIAEYEGQESCDS